MHQKVAAYMRTTHHHHGPRDNLGRGLKVEILLKESFICEVLNIQP